jgi:hypothetical protein
MFVAGVLGFLLLQSSKDQQKEFEKQVAKAVSDFDKAWGAGRKVEALDLLKGLQHEKAVQAASRALADSPEIKRKGIEILASIDHPKAAEVLAKAVKPNSSDKEMMAAFSKAADKCQWDIYYAALSDYLLTVQPTDNATAQNIFTIVMAAEKLGSMAFVDGLIKTLQMADQLKKDDENTKKFREQVIKSLKACTGEELADAKAYENWWKNNRQKAEALARYIMWCPVTLKRWDKKSTDTRAYCPNHGDKAVALRDAQIIAVKTLK